MKMTTYSPRVECQSANPYLNLSFNSRNGVRKRHRTHFTNQQIEQLESIFKQTTNPHRELVVQLSTLLNLTDKTISIWFKNRRAKCRREQSANKASEFTNKSHQKLEESVDTTRSEQKTYQNHNRQSEIFPDVKPLSTGHGNTIASKDIESTQSYYGWTENKEANPGMKEVTQFSESYGKHNLYTSYPVTSNYSQYLPGSIAAPRKPINNNPSQPTDSTTSSSSSPYDEWKNLSRTASSNFSWNSNSSHSTTYEHTRTSSSPDSISLANISDSSSHSTVSSSQGNLSDTASTSTTFSSITQNPFPTPLMPQYNLQTMYPYQYAYTRSYAYSPMTSADNVSHHSPYDVSSEHSVYPSLRSMLDAHW